MPTTTQAEWLKKRARLELQRRKLGGAAGDEKHGREVNLAQIVGTSDLAGLLDRVEAMAQQLRAGDLSGLERMLLEQAIALDGLAMELMSQASAYLECKCPELAQQLLQSAMSAQRNSRQAIATIATMKAPRQTAFIKTLNHLQIEQEQLSKRLEASPYAQMDTRGQGETSGTDTELATVDIQHRSA